MSVFKTLNKFEKKLNQRRRDRAITQHKSNPNLFLIAHNMPVRKDCSNIELIKVATNADGLVLTIDDALYLVKVKDPEFNASLQLDCYYHVPGGLRSIQLTWNGIHKRWQKFGYFEHSETPNPQTLWQLKFIPYVNCISPHSFSIHSTMGILAKIDTPEANKVKPFVQWAFQR